jgi:hypothetical protein
MEVGQKVRVVKVSDVVSDEDGFDTKKKLTQCVGKVFVVTMLQGGLLGIDVGALSGKPSYLETIFIEKNCVEVVS